MKFESFSQPLKDGRYADIRNAEPEDAEDMIEYLTITPSETPFLSRNPEEMHITVEEELDFINRCKASKRDLLLIAKIDGKFAATSSCMSLGEYQRYSHRCTIAIALYQKYCGLGLGGILLDALLKKAEEMGYEQAELEVISSNKKAVALYKAFGFEKYGMRRHSVKYKDGSYADEYLMLKNI